MRRLGHRLRGFAPRLTAARLIAHRDEQRGDVFAVLPGFGESRAGAMRLNPFGRQVDANGVGIGVGSFDSPLCARFRNLYVFDDAPSRVIKAAKEGSGTEQTSESAVAER
jgi:hypothetical protein